MKKRGLLIIFVLTLMLAFLPVQSVAAISESREETLKEMFNDMGFAATVAGGQTEFLEDEAVSPEAAFWFLSLNSRLQKYYSDASWCYELTVSKYMEELSLAFANYDEDAVTTWLQRNGYYNPEEGDAVTIYAGGMGDCWAWEPLSVSYDGSKYTVNGLFLYGNEEWGNVNLETDKEFYDYWMYTSEWTENGEFFSDTYAMGIENAISITIKDTDKGLVISSYQEPDYYCYEDTVYCQNSDSGKFDESFTVELAYDSVAYSGSAKKPSVVVRDRAGNVVDDDFYSLSYKNNKEIGEATVKCSIEKDGYRGVISSNFKIKPKAPTVKLSNDAASGKIKLTWDKVTKATSYKIYRATSKSGKYSLLKTVTGTSYTDTTAKAGTKYYYKVMSVASGKNSNTEKISVSSAYSSVVTLVCDLGRPTVTLSNVASSGKIKVSWTKVTGAAKYEVYRATSSSGKYTKVKTTTSLNYTDTAAKAGTKYYYKVKAIASNTAANSAYSAVKNMVCDLGRPTVTLSNVASSGKIKVSWTKVTGATKYEVYRATSSSGTYTKIKTTTSLSYTDTAAKVKTKYYYKVKAIASNTAANSAYSTVKNEVCNLARAKVTVKIAGTKPQVSWSKVSGAAKYQVYRATSQNGTYKLVKTTTSLSYKDTAAKKGTTYYYKVKAVASNTAANAAYSTIVKIKSK